MSYQLHIVPQSRSLGYAHWPERACSAVSARLESRSLGYAHWPELAAIIATRKAESRSLGYAHWPEHKP